MSAAANRLAWIPGGSSGIGLAAAVELARAGYRIVLSGRREDALQAAVAEVAAAGGEAHAVALDVSDAASVRAAHAAIVAAHGPVAVLINSAGFNIPDRSWAALTAETFDDTIAANLNGSFYTTLAVLPDMRAAGQGMIVNVISGAAKMVVAAAGTAYTAAKHAALAMTASLNLEEARNGIRACAFCPGEVDTPIMLKRRQVPSEDERSRMLGAEDVGRLIRLLVELPATVNVSELVVSSTGQPRAGGA